MDGCGRIRDGRRARKTFGAAAGSGALRAAPGIGDTQQPIGLNTQLDADVDDVLNRGHTDATRPVGVGVERHPDLFGKSPRGFI